jgi:hypothetical protein
MCVGPKGAPLIDADNCRGRGARDPGIGSFALVPHPAAINPNAASKLSSAVRAASAIIELRMVDRLYRPRGVDHLVGLGGARRPRAPKDGDRHVTVANCAKPRLQLAFDVRVRAATTHR